MGQEAIVGVLILGNVVPTWEGVVEQGKKIWVGEKILPGKGEKIFSVLTFSPKVHTCFARLPVAL